MPLRCPQLPWQAQLGTKASQSNKPDWTPWWALQF